MKISCLQNVIDRISGKKYRKLEKKIQQMEQHINTLSEYWHGMYAVEWDALRILEGYYSQVGQDKFLNEEVFKGKTGGFFVDVGAYDGVTNSNSYYFEKNLGWKGICIEPNPQSFEKLKQCREAECVNVAISATEGTVDFMQCFGGWKEQLSCIYDENTPKEHLEDIEKYQGGYELIKVPSKPLNAVLNEKQPIDLLSIDAEGFELTILQSIDLNKYDIKVLCLENNFKDNRLEDYLIDKGYIHLRTIRNLDEIYIKKTALLCGGIA